MSVGFASEIQISERASFLEQVAQELLESGTFPQNRIVLRQRRIRLLCNGYFLLNRAYKEQRIAEGHYTERPKIAALTCLSIMTFLPFRPVELANAQILAEAKPNEIYAFACGLGLMEIQFNTDTEQKTDLWLRVLDVISEAKSESLESYVTDLNMEIRDRALESYNLRILKKDELVLNSLITIFELISEKGKLLG